MDVESSFSKVGNFGKFQFYCWIVFSLVQVLLALQMVLMTIIGAKPVTSINSRGMVASDSNTIISEWNLFENTEVTSYIQSLYMFGVLLGNLFFGQLADSFGRKYVFSKTYFLFIFTAFLSTFANDYHVLGVIRFFVGFFIGGVGLISFVHCQELLGSSVWTVSGCVLPAFFSLGIAILAGIGKSVHDWRNICIATSLPGLILCFAYIPIPESPRWLYSKNKVSSAENVMKYIAEKNGNSCSTLRLKAKVVEKKNNQSSVGIFSLFSTKIMAKRSLVMAFVWFTCSFVYYGLTMNAGDLSSNRFTSLALVGLVELPAMALCACLINRPWAGRKRSLIGSLLLAAVSCFAVMFTTATPSDEDGELEVEGSGKLLLALVGKLSIAFAFTLIYIYSSELFPTNVRNVAMGTSSMSARIGGIIAPFFPTLAKISPPLPFVICSIFCLLSAFSCLLIPETLNKKIPDTISDLEPTFRYNRLSNEASINMDFDETTYSNDQTQLLRGDDTTSI